MGMGRGHCGQSPQRGPPHSQCPGICLGGAQSDLLPLVLRHWTHFLLENYHTCLCIAVHNFENSLLQGGKSSVMNLYVLITQL